MRFNYADDRLPVSMSYGGATYYLMYDQVGTLRAVANSSGNIIKQVDYDSFGNIINDSNPSLGIPFGFAGGLHDRDTGLVRFGYRDYDTQIGRWTAKDPIGFKGGLNLYGYVESDPVNGIDSNGLKLNKDTVPFPWPSDWPNGNMLPGYAEQDDKCSSIAAPADNHKCLKECCQQHDKCFEKYRCNVSSWIPSMHVLSPCKECNNEVVDCFKRNWYKFDCCDI